MIVYDILRDKNAPDVSQSVPMSGRVLRAVYDHTGVMSCLLGRHLADGVHFILWGKPGVSIETASDPVHHHVSRLMERPAEYAALFGTKTFIIEAPRNPDFMKARLPAWTPVGFVRDGVYRMEYRLP